MKSGSVHRFDAHGKRLEVKRVRRVWFLRVEGERRARWADTKKDATDDIRHFLDTGALPYERGESWA